MGFLFLVNMILGFVLLGNFIVSKISHQHFFTLTHYHDYNSIQNILEVDWSMNEYIPEVLNGSVTLISIYLRF